MLHYRFLTQNAFEAENNTKADTLKVTTKHVKHIKHIYSLSLVIHCLVGDVSHYFSISSRSANIIQVNSEHFNLYRILV